MNSTTRHICLIVLLGLLVGHIGVSAHAATHEPGDSGECHFCIAYGDTDDAVATVHEYGDLDGNYRDWSDIFSPASETRSIAPFRARGPPSAN